MRKLLEKHRALGPSARPLIGGHRGCVCEFPENTIKAMDKGIKDGASYLEIDIQITSDGIPVVFHDTELDSKTGLHGFVHEHSYAEIREHWPIETFEDVMEWGKKNDVCFALELKGEPAFTYEANCSLLGPMTEIVREKQMLDNVETFGIDYRILRKLKSIEKSFDIGLIVPFASCDPVSLMKDFDAMIYLAYANIIDATTARALMDAGYFVSGSILKRKEHIEYVCRCHMDMFEHDEPAKAVALMNSFPSFA